MYMMLHLYPEYGTIRSVITETSTVVGGGTRLRWLSTSTRLSQQSASRPHEVLASTRDTAEA